MFRFWGEGGFHHPKPFNGIVRHPFVETGYLLLLLHEHSLVRLCLFTVRRVECAHVLKLVYQHVVLVDIYVLHDSLLVGEVVGIHLPVIRGELLKHAHIAQPPVGVRHAAVTVPADARFHVLADEAGQHALVKGLQRRIQVSLKHLPAGHARIFLLVWVKRVVELHHVHHIVGYQLVPAVILLVLVGVVKLVEHFPGFCPVMAVLGIETADAQVVPVLNAALLRAVHRLRVFLLRVLWCAEPDERKQYAGLQERVFPLAHQVVLYLHLCRAVPAPALQKPEHAPEALHHQVHVLISIVGEAHHALAHHVVCVIGFRSCLRVLQLARKVAVVERNLAQ
ncbi:DUF2892 domain-containing protein [Prevotella sp. OH937_COT-195]|nr:DUF2892 domain-containing protein [Prevotella sp. OH937_COT-195]